MKDVEIRSANRNDVKEILEIYAYYVKETAITFEYDVPSVEEFAERITHTLEKYPYLAAVRNHRIIGYAYAGPFHSRAAYNWSAEVTIYTANGIQKQGVGRKLYETLEAALANMGILNLYACIAYPEVEDEYLTKNSAQFHEHMGYVRCGEFHKCGYKFGRWYDMIWMEKIIGEHKEIG